MGDELETLARGFAQIQSLKRSRGKSLATRERLNSSLDLLEASTGVRPKITFEDFVDHSLLKEAQLQQENK
jgi:hypothetical protein